MNSPWVLGGAFLAAVFGTVVLVAIGGWWQRRRPRFSAAADMALRHGATVSIDRHKFRGIASAQKHWWRRWPSAARRALAELRRPA